MDKFDFSALLKLHEKRHKGKPTQFSSVAGGVNKRLQNNLNRRKSSRLIDFDSFRNLASCVGPPSVSKAQQKVDHRRLQLDKWKEEKEKRKKEKGTQKKPFLTGIPHNSQRFGPPPPLKPLPSTSGRVTRSQTTQSNFTKSKKKLEQNQTASQSFAPVNAAFKPPQLKSKIPPLALNKPKKQTKAKITFDPIVPGNQEDVRQTRSKTTSNLVTNNNKKLQTKETEKETRGKVRKQTVKVPKLAMLVSTSSTSNSQSSTSCDSDPDKKLQTKQTEKETRGKVRKQTVKVPKLAMLVSTSSSISSQSSTSFDSDQSQPLFQNRPTRKSICTLNLPAYRNRTPRKSIKETKQVTPNNPVPKSESSSEERLRSPKSPVEVQKTPEQIVAEAKLFSPLVTMSRGKENARREMMKKMGEGLLVEDKEASDMDTVAQFRRQLASETDRINSMCQEWDNINNILLPEPVQEAILGAVGQARLLVSQKLVQFSQLVERCARGDHLEDVAALVTCADLHGFWDMVYMQVLNVDMRFKKLEEMRARNWTEETVEIKKKVTKQVAKKVVKPAGGNSRLREMIAAARKAKKEEVEQANSPVAESLAPESPAAKSLASVSPSAKYLAPESPAAKSPDNVCKTFEGGFFMVKSPVHLPMVGTPRNKSLLKAVLSSEAKKASASKNSASFAMLRASVLGKYVEYDGIEPLPQTPINLNATPARSILKSANTSIDQSTKKSIKMVLFDSSFKQPENDSEWTIKPIQNVEETPEEQIKEIDSGMSSMDQDQENKENSRTKGIFKRQDALDISPVMTRSRRKSMQTPEVSEVESKVRRSGRKMASKVSENSIAEVSETPKRSSRRRKSGIQVLVE